MPDDPDPTPPPSPSPKEAYEQAFGPTDSYQDVIAALGGARELIGLLKDIVARLEQRIDRIESALSDDDME